MSRSPKSEYGSVRSQMAIKEVRDGVLVLPNNQIRTILETSSLNFELQSSDEQDVIVEGFQSFLNSLNLPIQILIRIRELDIDHYLEDLEISRRDESVETFKKQLKSYSEFIRKLVDGNKILSRKFYVVVPYGNKNVSDFSIAREQILLEQEIIIKGLEKLGMTARPLSSLEILELFYSFYRPNQAKTQPLAGELLKHSYAFNLI